MGFDIFVDKILSIPILQSTRVVLYLKAVLLGVTGSALFGYTDLFLYAIKIFDSKKHKQYVGEGNELILENLSKLFKKGADIWISIPDVNDSTDEMQKIKDSISEQGKPKKAELLPYHAMGENKYRAIGKKLRVFEEPDTDKMEL